MPSLAALAPAIDRHELLRQLVVCGCALALILADSFLFSAL
jgi:hypothetical protein